MTDDNGLEKIKRTRPKRAPDMREPEDQGSAHLDVMPIGKDCPIVPLGVNGKTYYFLDELRQLIETSTKFDKGELTALFGQQVGWVDANFPMYNDKGEPKKNQFNQSTAQRALIIACQRKGLFDARDCVRGKGSHRGTLGELILHCGDQLLIAGEMSPTQRKVQPPHWRETGLHGELIFPTGKKIQHPNKGAATPKEMWTLLVDHFNSWNWVGPRRVELLGESCNIHAYLVFSWTMLAKVCGAVGFRPSLWVTGPTSAGKTGVHETLRDHIGKGWSLTSKDMTASWASQTLGHDRIPVLFDEAEPSAQTSAYHEQILQLAKLAYDGSSKGRGGADGKATTTEIHSCFQFSSVMVPPMKPEDRNRMIVVEVDKFPEGTPPYVQPEMVETLGPKATTRLAEQWHRFPETLKAYRGAMMGRNWSAREANTYGTVLAVGDLVLFDDVPDQPVPGDDGDSRIPHLLDCIEPMLVSSRAEGEDHPELCIKHLNSQRLPGVPGQQQETVAQWIIKAMVESVYPTPGRPVDRKLQSHGLKTVSLAEDHAKGNGQSGMTRLQGWQTGYLAIAGKTNQGVADLFKGSGFTHGGWARALERLKHKVLNDDGEEIGIIPAERNKRARFGGGAVEACVLVPLMALVGKEDVEEALKAETDRRIDQASTGTAEQRG